MRAFSDGANRPIKGIISPPKAEPFKTNAKIESSCGRKFVGYFAGIRLTFEPYLIGYMQFFYVLLDNLRVYFMTNDRWFSVDEIADYLGVKRDTVYKWIERRKMPAHKAGRLWKFRKEEVDLWVRTGSTKGSSSHDDIQKR